ncbi:hypothetical protein EMIT047CA2_90151 [Pseudomonas soli]
MILMTSSLFESHCCLRAFAATNRPSPSFFQLEALNIPLLREFTTVSLSIINNLDAKHPTPLQKNPLKTLEILQSATTSPHKDTLLSFGA